MTTAYFMEAKCTATDPAAIMAWVTKQAARFGYTAKQAIDNGTAYIC